VYYKIKIEINIIRKKK